VLKVNFVIGMNIWNAFVVCWERAKYQRPI